jgi:hypothetical protein
MEKQEQPIDITQLSTEDKKALKAELAKEEKAEKEKSKTEKIVLKTIGVEFLEKNIDALALRHTDMETAVAGIFKDLTDYIDLKANIYGIEKLDQDSHTVTHPNGLCSITIGYNAGISFDGTETAGVQKIMNYLTGLSGDESDENAQKLSKAVKFFLRPNFKTGMLNPGRIIQLNQMRKDFNSPEFDEGMDIIQDAQNKTKGSAYVSGYKHIDIGDNRTRKVEFRFTV